MKRKNKKTLRNEINELQSLLLKIDQNVDKENVWATYLISYSLSQRCQTLLQLH